MNTNTNTQITEKYMSGDARHKEEIRARISKKGIIADDIKHHGRLTAADIATLDVKKVYGWVRTGDWKQKDFFKWLKLMSVID